MKRYSAALVMIAFLLMISVDVNAQAGYSPALRIDMLRYDPYPAEAGSYFTLYLKVENTGIGDAENVECELVTGYPFYLDPDGNPVRSIGILPGMDYAIFEYEIRVDPNPVEGNNDLDIRCSTMGLDNEVTITETLSVNVESKNPEFAVGSIRSLPEELKADTEDIKLTVEVQNIGEGEAKLTTAKLSLPEGFSPSDSYSDMSNLGKIEMGSSGEAVFYIDVEEGVEPGIHVADLVLRYKDDNNAKNDYRVQKLELELPVKPSPMLLVEEIKAGVSTASEGFTGYIVRGDSVVNPSSITQGGIGELRIMVRNDGSEDAESVSVKVIKDSSLPFEFGEVYDFIGNLKPGQSSDAVFTFTTDRDAVLKKYLVDIEIRYVEDTDVKTVTDTIPLEVAITASDSVEIYFAIIAIIIVAGGILVWKRKK